MMDWGVEDILTLTNHQEATTLVPWPNSISTNTGDRLIPEMRYVLRHTSKQALREIRLTK